MGEPFLKDVATIEDLWVPTQSGRLFVRVWGDRVRFRAEAPIILFHDSLGCVALWRAFPAALAAATGHPVIAYDRLGFGRSDPNPGDLPLGFVRNEARSNIPALRSALEIDRMILFGHSVGGAMALIGGAHFSAETTAIITESAQTFVEDRTLEAIREARTAFAAPGQLDRLARYHGDKAAWVLRAWTDTWLHPEFSGVAIDPELERLRCPVLAIHGDRDEYGSRAHADRIARVASVRTSRVIFEDCGHVPHREKSGQVLDAVKAFLQNEASPL
jgi:pimeloyl-ACP methyl ester carboxylesterase